MKGSKNRLQVIVIAILIIVNALIVIFGLLIPVLLFEYVKNNVLTYYFFGFELRISTLLLFIFLFLISLGSFNLSYLVKFLFHRKKNTATIQSSQLLYQRNIKKTVSSFIIIGLFAVSSVWYYIPLSGTNLGRSQKYGPYIGYYGDSGMIISWDCADEESFDLFFASDISLLGSETVILDKIASIVEPWPENSNTNVKDFHHYVVLDEATDLVSNFRYYYQIPEFSKTVYSFLTASVCHFDEEESEEIIFTIVGDTQNGFAIEKKIVQRMIQDPDYSELDFTVIAGDLVNRQDKISEWSALFDPLSYGRISSSIPWMNAPGNHEHSCQDPSCEFREYYKNFFRYDYPQDISTYSSREFGLYYSFNNSNVHMISLDNFDNHTYTTENGYTQGSFLSTAQLKWLEEDLSRNQDPNQWNFVFFHVPMYSTGDYASNPELISQLEPIFIKYNVDAVFYGHDHHFETYYVNRNTSTDGIFYFTVGTGGGGIDDLTNLEDYGDRAWFGSVLNISQSAYKYPEVYGSEFQLYGELAYGYMKVKVVGDTAIFTMIRASDGSKIVEYTINH
ncbi:MAG: metallophosphoesterase family protein [Promethearchaeota archaeon]